MERTKLGRFSGLKSDGFSGCWRHDPFGRQRAHGDVAVVARCNRVISSDEAADGHFLRMAFELQTLYSMG
jgi:hypothetical protein